jgi:hypothetical protein
MAASQFARSLVQAIEAVAQKVAKQAIEEHSSAVALATIQLQIERTFQESKRQLAQDHDDRVTRIRAKVCQIVESRKEQRRSAREMGRLYDQVRVCAVHLCLQSICYKSSVGSPVPLPC